MSSIIDIRYAIRLLFKSPKFTALTLMVLIGGLSISLYTFSFLYSAFYKELPLPEGNTALTILGKINGQYTMASQLTANEYEQIRHDQDYFSEFGVYNSRDVRLSFEETGKNIPATYVDGGFFQFSRIAPLMGRAIQDADTDAGAEPVAVISHQVWQNEFAADENILNRSVRLNSILTQVVGVMPQGYRFPGVAKIWLPLEKAILKTPPRHPVYLSAYARINPEFSLEQVKSRFDREVDQYYQQTVTLYDQPKGVKSAELLSYPAAQIVGGGEYAFAFLNVVAFLILLLACINVGNLLLARAIERQKETAIRAALGASSHRLVSQLMWEGIIITLLGALLSVLLVGAALDYTNVLFRSWLPNSVVFWWQWGMDWQTLGIALIFTLLTIFFSSFIPAWRAAHQDINTTLRDGTRGAQSKKAGRLSRMLVTLQVFLVATLMLIGALAGFISNTFINLEIGDDYTNVLRAEVTLPAGKYQAPQEQVSLYQSLIQKIRNHPQVEDALIQQYEGYMPLTIEGMELPDHLDAPQVDTFSNIGNTEFLAIRLVDGRHLNHQDTLKGRKVALISQSMANRYWPGESALERQFQLEVEGTKQKFTVVGIVTNRMNPRSLFGSLDSEDEVYLSGQQFVNRNVNLFYRAIGNELKREQIFYQALFDIDPTIELTGAVRGADKNRNLMRDSMKLTSKITLGTGLFALTLALVGIYGLTSNAVARRTHEVGIRRAVGANDNVIIGMFIKQGLSQLFIGLGLALLVFTLISLGFHNFTQGIIANHVYFTVALTVVIVLSFIVMLAIYAPTRRAVEMEPNMALRYE